jgi:hypothetical protein
MRELEIAGVSRAPDLARNLRLSQASISLAVKELGARVIRFGSARSSRYGLSREIGREGDRWPLYSINEHGMPELTGTLVALQQREWAFQPEQNFRAINVGEFADGLYPDLPWFLDTIRPQGFLGRSFAKRTSLQLGLPADPTNWSADDVVVAALRNGSDFPGSFVLGDEALVRAQSGFLNESESEPQTAREIRYPELAYQALRGELPGSSAGGEQPKFTTSIRENGVGHVVVKFSGQTDSPSHLRWRDLLIAEQVASQSINDAGVPVVSNRTFEFGGRTFLESERFDRIGIAGRISVVPLSVLDGAFYGLADTPWTAAAERLGRDKMISEEDINHLRWLWWFGDLIGNDDMHYGNVSLFPQESGTFKLSPCYDMLPMRYRPANNGELVDRNPNPTPPPPQAFDVWKSASNSALGFWEQLLEEKSVSAGFLEIAETNIERIKLLRVRFA